MEKLSFGASLGAVMQVSFIVDDMERELWHWTQTLRVGPFFYLPHFPLADTQYRGSRIEIDLDVALAFSGSTCYELVRQNDDVPSPFREMVATRGFGFHHWAVPTRTFEADLRGHQKNGMAIVASAMLAGTRKRGYTVKFTGEMRA